MESLADEYRATMPPDVLHLWAQDAVAQLSLLPELIEALEDIERGLVMSVAAARARSILTRIKGTPND